MLINVIFRLIIEARWNELKFYVFKFSLGAYGKA